ncbi:MAG: hypothetical protein WAU54_19180, partial [Chania sp.]
VNASVINRLLSLATSGFKQIIRSVTLFKSVVTAVLNSVQYWLPVRRITNTFNPAAGVEFPFFGQPPSGGMNSEPDA